MKIKDFKAGQEVAIISGSKREKGLRPAIVSKVGRKFVYATAEQSKTEICFKVPGYSADYLVEDTPYGGGAQLFPSIQAAKDYESKNALRLWLHQVADWGASSQFTLEQLRQVKAILCPDEVQRGD